MVDNPKEYSEKDQWDDDLDVPPINYVEPKVRKPILEEAKFDKKKKPYLISVVAIIGILTIGILVLFINKKSIWNSEEVQLGQKTIIKTDSSRNESTGKPEKKQGAFTEELTYINEPIKDSLYVDIKHINVNNKGDVLNPKTGLFDVPKNFHIVIGSFQQEQFAYSFASNKKNLSEDVKVIKSNGWYRISHSSYLNNLEAQIALEKIKNSLNLTAWITYME